MRSVAAALLASLLPLAVPAQQPDMRAQVVIVESLPDFERWAQSGTGQAPYSRNLTEVPVGKPVHFPIVVSGLRPPAADLNLVADIEFFAPSGASLGVLQQCCRFTASAGTEVRTAVLSNAATLTFGANDVRGTYSVAVSVTDGARTVTTREAIRFPGPPEARQAPAPAAPSAAAEAPKLRMSIPDRNPGKDGDKRDCLSLPTPAEIIKCAEKRK